MSSSRIISRIGRRLDRQLVDPIRRRFRAAANSDRFLDPIFVTGAMGSGTTLLGLELGQRFQTCGIANESCLALPRSAQLHVDPISNHQRIRDYERSLLPRREWNSDSARMEIMDLYRQFADAACAPIVDKAANAHLCRLEFLNECFPGASMLVVFRDPRATIEGFRRKWPTFGRDDLSESIRFYRDLHQRFLDARTSWQGPLLLLSYESLVARPDATFSIVQKLLDLSAATTGRRLKAQPNVVGQGIRNVDRGSIKIVSDANRHAIDRLPPREAEEIQNQLGGLHASLLRLADNE